MRYMQKAVIAVFNGAYFPIQKSQKFHFSTSIRFNVKATMEEHIRIEHQHFRHVCHVCGKEYRTYPGLHAHLRSHSDVGPRLKCKMCPNKFKTIYWLRLHQAKEHHIATLLQCPYCPKKKTNQFQLKKHIALHTYKPHKCDLCEREFRSPAELTVGIRALVRQSMESRTFVNYFVSNSLAASHEKAHHRRII